MSPLWISLQTTITATLLVFFLGITAARFMISYHGRYKGLLDGLLILPLVLPPTVVGFLLLLLFGRYGPAGKLLTALDATIIFSWPATVITATVVAFPLMYRTARGALEQVDRTLPDAARTLGLTERYIFWRILLPLARPGILAGTVLAFARALGEFGATLMLAGNIPGKTQTIPMAIYFLAESGRRQEAGYWVAGIMLISLIAAAALHYLNNTGYMGTWRKGA